MARQFHFVINTGLHAQEKITHTLPDINGVTIFLIRPSLIRNVGKLLEAQKDKRTAIGSSYCRTVACNDTMFCDLPFKVLH